MKPLALTKLLVLLVVTLGLVVSCGGEQEGPQGLAARLAAAHEISSQVAKEEALAAVAVDAAEAGNIEVTMSAIATISSQVQKEKTAAEAALALAEAGQATAAIGSGRSARAPRRPPG